MRRHEKLIIMFRGSPNDLLTKQQIEAGYTLEIAVPPIILAEGMLILKCPDGDNIIIDGTHAQEREVQFQVFTKEKNAELGLGGKK